VKTPITVHAKPVLTLDWWVPIGSVSFWVTGVPAIVGTSFSTIALPELAQGSRLVAAYAARLGLVNPLAFRFTRKALGLRAADLGERFCVSGETISHWETGATRLPFVAWGLLVALVFDAIGETGTLEACLRDALSPAAGRAARRAAATIVLPREVPRGCATTAFVVPYKEAPKAKATP